MSYRKKAKFRPRICAPKARRFLAFVRRYGPHKAKLTSEDERESVLSDDDFEKYYLEKFSNDGREPLLSDDYSLHEAVSNVSYQFRFLFFLNIIILALRFLTIVNRLFKNC